MKDWTVYKFGGSSLADADCFRRVAGIATAVPGGVPLGIVVSAMGGMTDALLALIRAAEAGAIDFAEPLADIAARYEMTVGCLLAPENRTQVLADFHADIVGLGDVLKAISLVRSAPQRSQDLIAGFGEIWSARLLSALLDEQIGASRDVNWLDARKALTVRQTKLAPTILWEASRERLGNEIAADFSGIVVITGFIASDETGLQTTLGRNGSDFSASIFAALLEARDLTIWTDVDGVLSADPRRVPEAEVIDTVSYNEAMELAYFGAKVIHPQTMGPAVENDIPILIRNTFQPARPGTRIIAVSDRDQPIKGITAIDGIALINVEGAGMIGVPGTADRLFSALHAADVSVVLISQASSEHSICCAVPESLAEAAVDALRRRFATELSEGQIQRIEAEPEMSILALVGDGMNGVPGIAGRFLGTLGGAGINAAAIAQGSSERNISVVVRRSDSTRALRAVHSGFYLSRKTLSIGLLGPGTVGSELLKQIRQRSQALAERFNLDLRVRAIAGSKRWLHEPRRIDLARWQDAYADAPATPGLAAFVDHVDADHLPHSVIVDCTADDNVAAQYPSWLRRGVHIVTPNKKAFSGASALAEEVRAAAAQAGTYCLYETTVGAGLPVIHTLQDLIATGDRIRSVDGIFSGTLAYLFNQFDGSVPFSTIVATARQQGYTEPDPRDDLSGMDVARKATILAREIGLDVDLDSLAVESLVPAELVDVDVDTFMARLPEYDDAMAERHARALAAGRKLRYVGRLDAERGAEVGLIEVDDDHSFANINLTDNVIRFTTDRYSDNPLVVQGPGAGPAVTAAGVFADVLRLASFLQGGD
ncbi:MAG: bifunctional aspartate kinase/homoserine dehydrogenase I [Pseudomonadota bacterium]